MQFFFSKVYKREIVGIFLLLKRIDQSCFNNDHLFVASAKLQLFQVIVVAKKMTIFFLWYLRKVYVRTLHLISFSI